VTREKERERERERKREREREKERRDDEKKNCEASKKILKLLVFRPVFR